MMPHTLFVVRRIFLSTRRRILSQALPTTYSTSCKRTCKCPFGSHTFQNYPWTKTGQNVRSFSTCRSLSKDESKTNQESGTQSASSDETDTRTLLESWYYEVCSRGSLTASLPFPTHIQPLNPQVYPDMNKVILQLHFDTEKSPEVPSPHELSEISDLYDLQVGFDADKANMNVSCDVTPGVSLPVVCTMKIPLHFDLKVDMRGDADVAVQKMESNSISVETDKGNCSFKSLKCGSVTAMCRSGSILSSSTLLGNILFHTGQSGCIETGKLQGGSVSCETAMGSVSVQSLYTGAATFRSEAGPIRLGNCHGQLCVQAENSQLTIESLEGDVDASLQTGNINVHFSKHAKSHVEVKTTGNITLSFPEGVSTDLNLDCPEVVVEESIEAHLDSDSQPHHLEGHIGEKGKACINARTLSGRIQLRQLDWIQTTKLASFFTQDRDS